MKGFVLHATIFETETKKYYFIGINGLIRRRMHLAPFSTVLNYFLSFVS